MTPPDWLLPIVQQYPIAALAVAAAWLGYRSGREGHRREVARLEAQLERAERQADAAEGVAADARRAEGERLTQFYRAEVRRLHARIRELERRAGPPEDSP